MTNRILIEEGLYDTDEGIRLRVTGDEHDRLHLTPQGLILQGDGTGAPTEYGGGGGGGSQPYFQGFAGITEDFFAVPQIDVVPHVPPSPYADYTYFSQEWDGESTFLAEPGIWVVSTFVSVTLEAEGGIPAGASLHTGIIGSVLSTPKSSDFVALAGGEVDQYGLTLSTTTMLSQSDPWTPQMSFGTGSPSLDSYVIAALFVYTAHRVAAL